MWEAAPTEADKLQEWTESTEDQSYVEVLYEVSRSFSLLCYP